MNSLYVNYGLVTFHSIHSLAHTSDTSLQHILQSCMNDISIATFVVSLGFLDAGASQYLTSFQYEKIIYIFILFLALFIREMC